MLLEAGGPVPADVLPIGAHDKIGDTVSINIAQRRHGYPEVALLLFCRIQKGEEKCTGFAAENEGFAGVDRFKIVIIWVRDMVWTQPAITSAMPSPLISAETDNEWPS